MKSPFQLFVAALASSGAFASSASDSSTQAEGTRPRSAYHQSKRLMRTESDPWDDGVTEPNPAAGAAENPSSDPDFHSTEQDGAEVRHSVGPMFAKKGVDAGLGVKGSTSKSAVRERKQSMTEPDERFSGVDFEEDDPDGSPVDRSIAEEAVKVPRRRMNVDRDEAVGIRNPHRWSRSEIPGSVAAFADGSGDNDNSPSNAELEKENNQEQTWANVVAKLKSEEHKGLPEIGGEAASGKSKSTGRTSKNRSQNEDVNVNHNEPPLKPKLPARLREKISHRQRKQQGNQLRPESSRTHRAADLDESAAASVDEDADDSRPRHGDDFRTHQRSDSDEGGVESVDEDVDDSKHGTRHGGSVDWRQLAWRRKMKARMSDLERAGVAEHTALYNMLQRLEKAEAKQESSKRDFEKVFSNLESLVQEDLANEVSGQQGAIDESESDKGVESEEDGDDEEEIATGSDENVDTSERKIRKPRHANTLSNKLQASAAERRSYAKRKDSQKQKPYLHRVDVAEKDLSVKAGGPTSHLQLQFEEKPPPEAKALAHENCMLHDRYGNEYVKHHTGSVSCLSGGVPVFDSQANQHQSEMSLLSTGTPPPTPPPPKNYFVEFCTLSDFTENQIQTMCATGSSTYRECPCQCEAYFPNGTGNVTNSNCLPSQDSLDNIIARYSFIDSANCGTSNGVPMVYLENVDWSTLDSFRNDIDNDGKGYRIRHVEDDHYLGQREDNSVAEDEYPVDSWTCYWQKISDDLGGWGEIQSWGLDRIDDSPDTDALDCRSQDQDTGTLGEGVNIWILDTGIYAGHEDFGGRAIAAIDMTIDNSLVKCTDPAAPADCGKDRNGHGTHCAGSAAGKAFGVAKKANVFGAKVLSDNKDGRLGWILSAIDHIIEDFLAQGGPPTVMSMSLGGKGNSPTLRSAVDRAIETGIVVTVASGNQGEDACEYNPAFVPDALTVAASSSDDKMPDFSNYGACVDIIAPGAAIKSTWWDNPKSIKDQSGTSMACPHVAGAAALVLSADPSMNVKAKGTQDSVAEKLVSMAIDGAILIKPGTPNKLLNVADVKVYADPGWQRFKVKSLLVGGVLLTLGCLIGMTYCLLCASKAPNNPNDKLGAGPPLEELPQDDSPTDPMLAATAEPDFQVQGHKDLPQPPAGTSAASPPPENQPAASEPQPGDAPSTPNPAPPAPAAAPA